MEAYEFYWLDPKGRCQSIGVLPERRRDIARANKESIMRWANIMFGKGLDTQDIFFIRVTLEEDVVSVLQPFPLILAQRDSKT